MRFRTLVFLVVLVVVVGVGFAFWRGSGPLPGPEGCTAKLGAQRVDLATEQAENATLIAAIVVSRGLPARAVSIALATAYQESKIRNLTHGDRDSRGLFQQLDSWGPLEDRLNPTKAATMFYTGGAAGQPGLTSIPGWPDLPVPQAAQAGA